MLKRINQYYLIFGSILFLLFLPKVNEYYYSIYLANFISLLSFGFIIKYFNGKNEKYYNKTNLLITVFVYSIFFVGINKFLSYYYTGNFFVFSEADAEVYHLEAQKMIQKTFGDGIHSFLSEYSFEDLGAVLVISTLYRVIESNLFVNVFYLLLSLYTGVGIFKIGQHLMPNKFSFLSALTFSISSFYLWFNSSGLKESVLVFLVIQCFLNYYNFLKLRKPKYIVYLILFLLSLMLFRPAIMFLIIGAMALGILLSRRKNVAGIFLSIILFAIIVFAGSYITFILNKFMGGDIDQMIAGKESEGMIKGGVIFTYLVNTIAGLIGPFPTLLPNEKTLLSFYAPGLIYKIFISIPFLFGIVYVFIKKKFIYYPIALFVLLEMSSLVFILEALELRKSLPHFPFIYLISFGFISSYASGEINKKRRKSIITIFNFSFIIIFFLILYWNYR
ncbi:MAG TPA: hypothetical protein PKZ43_07470 [Bacteroidales bacterium]|nr:hypothetical protein [Bacteroidales bacterium]